MNIAAQKRGVYAAPMTTIMRGWVWRLYPNRQTAERLHQWAGAANLSRPLCG
jgi:hypothetical protein